MKSGQNVLHYRILEKIGKGGMGEVYKAEDLKLGRQVAIKLLPPEASQDENAKRRLLQEARAASALNHPNIITIHSIEEADGLDFIVMEYVEGETLGSLTARKAIDLSQLLELGAQVADGLAAAHSAGLIHRDIKSSNILVTPRGQAKILDFGLAKLVQFSDQKLSGEQTMTKLTKTGMIVGTVAYMSPEQTRGEPLDSRTDIFSFGCVLYEAATGKVPFSGPSVLSVLHEIATLDPPAPSTISQRLPHGLDAIIKRALAKKPEERYSSAAEMAEALRSLRFANRYQILREIGRGGMGVVYLARDPLLERDVAIKVITPDLLSAEAEERFKREARVVAKMDHPAIVSIYDIGEHERSLFFVMPYVQGNSLRTFLTDGSLSLGEAIDIGIQVADALEYSHLQNVVHRDIKPENILVLRQESAGEMRVRVTDFGLAMASSENRLTKTGSIVGTMAYLSPEQLSSKAIDSRSDIYSLGVVLYECLVGQPPFTGEVQSVLYRIAHDRPDSPRALGSEIQEEFENILMQCLEKDPASRPQRAREVADALKRHRSKLRDSDRLQKLSMIHKSSTQMQRPAGSPLIGREKEFAELQRRLSAASLQGECQFVVVGGEAGIGKGRLLDELEKLAKARKIRVLHSRFVEQDQAFPFQGFCEAIQEYFRTKMAHSTGSGPVDFSDLASDLVSLFPVLAEMNEITGGQKLTVSGEAKKVQDRTYIFDLLARSFVRIGAGKPLIIFFEDLHNADVSIEALQYVIRRLGPTPTLVVGTYRTTEVDKQHPLARMIGSFQGDRRFEQVSLQPFTPAEHLAFLQTLIGSTELEKSFVDKLYEATEGNPHFTKEIFRSLIDSGRIIKSDTGAWNLSAETAISSETLPPTIQQAVEKRIERLPEDWKDVLSIASILGRSFEARDLEVLAEEKEKLDDIIDKLIASGFLEEERASRGEQLGFSSGIVRDVLYSQVPRRRKRALHRRYAEILEKRHAGRLERVYAQLVHHYSEGDVSEKVIEFGMASARKSLEAFSSEDALRAARIVLDFVQGEEGPVLEGEVRTLIAEAHRMGGNIDTALQELETAIRVFERGKDPSRALSAMVLAAETAWERLRVDETKRWVERAIGIATATGQTEILAKLLSLGATVANLRGEYEKARQYLEQAEHVKPAIKERVEIVPIGGRLVVTLPVPVAEIDPAIGNIIEETEILANVLETLLSVDEQGHLIPGVCKGWDVLEQGKSFLFTLRSNVRMHDGRPLTSEQVRLSFENAILLSRERLPAAYSAIRGVSDFINGSTDHVSGIDPRSESALVINLEAPLPIYPAFLTDPRSAIFFPSGEESQKIAVGTGPFKMKSFRSDHVILEQNQDYWTGNLAPLESIEFRCGVPSAEIAAGLRSGKVDLASDLLPEDLEEILQDRQLRASLVEAPKKNIYFVLFNSNSPVCQIQEIRQALSGIVRIDDLVRATLGRFAQPAEGLLPPGILGHDPGRRRPLLSREKAMEMIRSKMPAPPPLKAAVHPVLQDRYASLTKALFKVWSDMGIEISVETHTMTSFVERSMKSEGIDLMVGRWVADYDDPDNFVYTLFHSRVGEFRSYYSSKELDRIIEEARAESRPEARERLYRKIETLLIETGFLLPLFHEVDYRVASPKVRKLVLRSTPPYVNYAELGKAETTTPTLSPKTGGGILQVPITGDLTLLDPSIAGTYVQSEVIPSIFESLTREAEGARIIPWLASEFHAEEGGKRFRFRLREDVRFHDGRRLTARDVRYSFEHLLQNRDSGGQWLLSSIIGANALRNGERRELEGFRILSTLEFIVDLEQPISFFPALLAYNAAAIIPEGSKISTGNWREGCVGTGPFRVQRFEPGRRLELETNPDYWRHGYPKSDGLVFTFGVSPENILSGFRTGRFAIASNLFPSDVELLRHDPEFASRYREIPQLSTYFLVFNIHRGPLSDESLRHQLVQAVDVEGLVRRTIGRLALPAQGIIPPGLLGYEASRRSRQPSAVHSIKNIELTGMLNSIYEGPYASLSHELFKSLEEKGIRVRITSSKYEQHQFHDVSREVDLVLTRWIADYPDADTFIHGMLHSQKGYEGLLCGTPEMDRLIERGRTETDPNVRHDIYQQAEQIVAKRALLLPLFHEQTYRFARPEVEEFELNFSTLQPVPYEKLWLRR